MRLRRQQGLTTVEFAVVATALFVMLFGIIEVGRAYFVFATLEEVTRRAARLAAVCPVNDPAVARLAVFNDRTDAGDSDLVHGLNPTNVTVEYLDVAGAVIVAPADPTNFLLIRYVRTRITGFQHQFNVPFVTGMGALTLPPQPAVLPRESLGVPRDGVVTPC